MYTIYKITSPSGKFYIGLTSLKPRDRWDAHCTTARRGKTWNPFHCAIRKYGKDAFRHEVLELVATLAEANAAEIRWIEEYRSTDRRVGYNTSPGGGYDSVAGVEGMRLKMADPEWAAGYRARLSRALKLRPPESFIPLVEGGKRWRKENPVQNYKNGRRAMRMATAAQNRPWTGVPGEGKRMRGTWGRLWIPSEKVRWARHTYFTKRNVKDNWASMDLETKKVRGKQISDGQKAAYQKDPERKAKNFEQMKQARANVDRKKQAAAASAGQKNWWVELRKDPDRYVEYIERRRQTLLANLRHRKRGTKEPLHD